MRIFPIDIENRICPSCDTRKCDPSLTIAHEMYRITGVSNNRISFIKAMVYVPQCRECKNNSQSAKVFPILMLLFLTLILIYCAFIDGGMPFLTFLWCEVLTVVVSLISWAASIWGVKFTYKTKGLSNYKPIYIMEKYGWQHSSPQKKEEFKSLYTDNSHRAMLMEIIDECGCDIS